MNKLHKRRLYILSVFALGLSLAAGLILYALRQNINVFMTPSQLISAHISTDYYVRLGGMVKPGSVKRDPTSLAVDFIVTDLKQDLAVHYVGVLPDLFREGKGVIAEGRLNAQGNFAATQILAKHDENYMPKNVYKALREQKAVMPAKTLEIVMPAKTPEIVMPAKAGIQKLDKKNLDASHRWHDNFEYLRWHDNSSEIRPHGNSILKRQSA